MVWGGFLRVPPVHIVVDQVTTRSGVRRRYVVSVGGQAKGIHNSHGYSAVIFVQTTQEREAYASRS